MKKLKKGDIVSTTMLLTPHTIVGLAIGASIQNPFIAVPLSFAMHFLGDTVPHWDFYSNTTKEERIKGWRPIAVMADLVLGVFLGLTVTYYVLWVLKNPNAAATIFMCGVSSVLPDAIEAPYIYMQNQTGVIGFITSIQRKLQFQAPLPWGIITQVLVIAVSGLVIVNSLGL